jgi:hypothetical protein
MTPHRKTWSITITRRSGWDFLLVIEERGTQCDADNAPFNTWQQFGFKKTLMNICNFDSNNTGQQQSLSLAKW